MKNIFLLASLDTAVTVSWLWC